MTEVDAEQREASRMTGVLSLVVGLAATIWFAWGLASEPRFVDESAGFSQAFYADLYLSGRWDDPAWLEYPAVDHPPMQRYLIGMALRVVGARRPDRAAVWRWYADTSSRFETAATLVVARWPSVLLGALGCVAIFGLGTLARDRRVGLVAAALLALNPLYALHARRAMADVPAEALILATVAVGLWSWRAALAGRSCLRNRLAAMACAGGLGGLAVLAKLNGALGLMVLGAWGLLAAALPGVPARRKVETLLGPLLAGAVALSTFILLNPLLTAQPARPSPAMLPHLADLDLWHRVGAVIDHRVEVSRTGKAKFAHDALWTPMDQIKAVAVQGFGRFGPFGPRWSDSTRRFDWKQDWGGLVWGPWVGVGLVWGLAAGRGQTRDGRPPTAWAVSLYALVALASVTAFIPLAWDRYFLSIQPGAALLAAGGAVAAWEEMVRRARGHHRKGAGS